MVLLVMVFAGVNGQAFQWAKGIGATENDWVFSMEIDKKGNVYTTGSFTYTLDFDPGPGVYNMTSNGQGDAFISKLDSNGNIIWYEHKQNGEIVKHYRDPESTKFQRFSTKFVSYFPIECMM